MSRPLILGVGSIVLASAAALAAPVAVAAPAAAAEDGALISLDGTAFSAAPDGSVFPSGIVLIPGSSADGRFWVRNSSGVPAELRVAVLDASATTPAFIDSLTVQAGTPSTPPGAPMPLGTEVDCAPLLVGEVLEPGATTEVTLALALSAKAGNEGQGAAADARLAVTLADASAGPADEVGCRTDDAVALLAAGPGAAHPDPRDAPRSDDAAAALTETEVPEVNARGTSPGEEKAALPTLPFSGDPAISPGLVGAAALLAAAAALILFLVRRRRRPDDETQ